MFSIKTLWPAVALLVAAPLPAAAALTIFSGEDVMATTTSAHPVSAAAASAFDTAASGASLITFESAPLGGFTTLTGAPGVTLSGTDVFGNPLRILNASNSPSFPTLDGYNTTASGANFVELFGGTLTFTFATGVDAFGAYFSGIQNFLQDTVTFSDGTSQTLNLPESGVDVAVGALDFVGFTDPGKHITSIAIHADNGAFFDAIGVDDVRFRTSAGVPEPASWALMILGLGGVGAALRGRRWALGDERYEVRP